MVSDNEIEYKIEGDSIDECKKKLYDQYGKDYLIKDKKVEFRRAGLFKRQKAITLSLIHI